MLVPIYVKLRTVKTSLLSKLSRVDWVGGFFFIGGLTSFLVGISWAGIQFEWKSAQAVTPMIIGIIGVTTAIIWEIYGAREPFLRPSLFYSTSALATYACALFQGFIVCLFFPISQTSTALGLPRTLDGNQHRLTRCSCSARSTTSPSISPPSDLSPRRSPAWTSSPSPAFCFPAASSSR